MGIFDVFGRGGSGRSEPVMTELQALLIGESPRRNWGAYLAENTRRRQLKLPLGSIGDLVANDEGRWWLDMAWLGTETIDEGFSTMPMSMSQFQELQSIADQWNAGDLVPHKWFDGKWFFSTPYSVVPRFRFDMGTLVMYPARADDWVDDFQRAQMSIGIDPGDLIRPDPRREERLRKGKAVRAEGIYVARGHLHNEDLRRGQVGYPVVLPPPLTEAA